MAIEAVVKVRVDGVEYGFRLPSADEIAEFGDAITSEKVVTGAKLLCERCAIDKPAWRQVQNRVAGFQTAIANKLNAACNTATVEFVDMGKEPTD